jgi:hypothetical protein
MPEIFARVMEYDHLYYERGYVYYVDCVYKGREYSYIKLDVEFGVFTLYSKNNNCEFISLKQFA